MNAPSEKVSGPSPTTPSPERYKKKYGSHCDLVLALAAAQALDAVERWGGDVQAPEELDEVNTVETAMRASFAKCGVMFDVSGNPIAPQTVLVPTIACDLRALAAEVAYEVIEDTVEPMPKGGHFVAEDFLVSALWDAFNAGGLEEVSIGLGQVGVMHPISPVVHAVHDVTGQCLGHREY